MVWFILVKEGNKVRHSTFLKDDSLLKLRKDRAEVSSNGHKWRGQIGGQCSFSPFLVDHSLKSQNVLRDFTMSQKRG